jgi:hypothetical protein
VQIGGEHEPATHDPPPVHAAPHVPQCAGLTLRSTHVPSHFVSPEAQGAPPVVESSDVTLWAHPAAAWLTASATRGRRAACDSLEAMLMEFYLPEIEAGGVPPARRSGRAAVRAEPGPSLVGRGVVWYG